MIEEDLGRLEERFGKFRIIGSSDVNIAGDIFHGYAVNVPQCPPVGAGTPTPSGACCPENGDCFISSRSFCESFGGDYQGDGTPCDPNPCPPFGACCVGEDCSILTEDACDEAGGTYQGDDTECDPNPCETPSCHCAVENLFRAFDGSERYFRTYHVTKTDCPCCDEGCNLFTCTCSATATIDPDTCEVTVTENDCCDVPPGGTCGGVGGCCSFLVPGDAVVTATTWTQHHHFDGLCCFNESCDQSGMGVLSDECIP